MKLTIDYLDTQVQKQKNSVTCTTGNLIKLNDRINDSLNDIYLMTNEVTFSELFSYLYQCFQSLIHLTSHDFSVLNSIEVQIMVWFVDTYVLHAFSLRI